MLRNLLIVVCLLTAVSLSFGQKKKNKDKSSATVSDGIDYKAIGADLPPLKIYRRDGVYLTSESLNDGANLFIMMFNPTCDHCEDMTFKFKENIGLFKKSQLVLVAAPSMGPYLGYFTNNTRLEVDSPIQVGLDSCDLIKRVYTYESLPQINIYNKERKLVKVFTGVTPIDSLKPYIE